MKTTMPKRSENLRAARKVKNDEFYTRLVDVEDELSHYPGAFHNKTVYCNCDDATWSNFPRFFLLHFRELGLRRLIATCYNGEPGEGDTPDMFAEPTGLTAWKLDVADYDGDDIDGFINAHIEKLHGNGSFTSSECVALLREADIVVTNPPFSLFGKFSSLLFKEEKDFLVVGHTTNVLRYEIFQRVKDRAVFLENFNKTIPFITKDGEKEIQVGWFTTLVSNREHPPLRLTQHYSAEKYPRLDDWNAINVNRTADIPDDYFGVMAVPLTFFARFCPAQFSILGSTSTHSIPDKNLLDMPFQKTKGGSKLNGEDTFARIFIRRIPPKLPSV